MQDRPFSLFKKTKNKRTYERPDKVKKYIDRSFDAIKQHQKGEGYIFTGAQDYTIIINTLRINSKDIIEERLKHSNSISVLDVGAGDFSFKRNNDKRYSGKVETYGIAAHDYFRKAELRKTDEYHIFDNAEYLHKIYGEDKFDVVLSFRTFIHFIDPVGALIEAYKTLKPGGILLVDGFYIRGSEQYTNTILNFLKAQGYSIITNTSDNNKATSFIIKKTEDKPELNFPLVFSKIITIKDKNKYVKYEPTSQLKSYHTNDLTPTHYVQGLKYIKEQIKGKIEKKIIDECDDLNSLFANATYQSLPSNSQYLCILGLVSKKLSYKNYNELLALCHKADEQSKYKNNFSELLNDIKIGDNSFLFNLSNNRHFKFYQSPKANLSKDEAIDQQLRIIQVTAMEDIIRLGRMKITKYELNSIGIPSRQTRLDYEGNFLDFSELASFRSNRSRPT